MKKGLSKQTILSSVPFVCVADIVIVLGCLEIQGLIVGLVSSDAMDPFVSDVVLLGSFVVPIIVTLAFMYVMKRESLRVFGGSVGKIARSFLVGLLIGLTLNAGISVAVGLSGSVAYTFNGMSPLLLAILPFVFIQCSSEEIADRGFVPAFLEERHSRAVIALVSGGLFALGHISNLLYFGFNAVFCVNVVLFGVLLYLLTQLFDNFWVAPGCHMAWNYSQTYLFGLPNSGYSVPFAVLRGDNAQTGFFYDATYGNEGSLFALMVIMVTVGVLIVLLRRKESRIAEGQAA